MIDPFLVGALLVLAGLAVGMAAFWPGAALAALGAVVLLASRA